MSLRHVRPLFIALFLGLLAPDAAHSAKSQCDAVVPDQASFLSIGHDEVFICSGFAVQGPTALVDTTTVIS